jgi:hypothetical protein
METLVLNIQSSDQRSIVQKERGQKNISFWGINISLRVIELRKKKGSYSAGFKAVEEKLL